MNTARFLYLLIALLVMDSARAIQHARLHAREWNLDPLRVGATGSSAGAGTSLWIGFHD